MINLLPWREKYRQQLKKRFWIISGVVMVFSFVLTGCIYGYYAVKIKQQYNINQIVIDENNQIDKKIEAFAPLLDQYQSNLEQMSLVQMLQHQKTVAIVALDDISKKMPKEMYLTEIHKVNNKVEIKGFAKSAKTVTDFIRQLEQSSIYEKATMQSFQKSAEHSAFHLTYAEQNYGRFSLVADLSETAIWNWDNNTSVQATLKLSQNSEKNKQQEDSSYVES